jgi:tetratricopeptide (TPR) repeat protein
MPAHIYERVGDYQSAARSNVDAAAADEVYFKATGVHGVYSMYYMHNLDFLAVANSMQGRYRAAIAASDKLVAFSKPLVQDMPMIEPVLAKSLLMMVRFHKWDEILKQPRPEASLKVTSAFWHFARAMAFEGNDMTVEAGPEAFIEAEKLVPAEQMFGLNPATQILKIAEYALQARIARMTRRDPMIAIEFLRKGVEIEDSLAYDEPPAWFLPMREALGGALMMKGDFAAAEQVFRDDLLRNRRNGRSLFGLMESLKAQKKDYSMAQAEFERAWKTADEKLTLRSLWR